MGWATRSRPVFRPLEIRTGPPSRLQIVDRIQDQTRAVNEQALALVELREAYAILAHRVSVLEDIQARSADTSLWQRLIWLVRG